MSQVVSFKKFVVTNVFALGGNKRSNVISHIALVVMFASCLGFPLMYGYDNMGLGLDVLPSVLLGIVIGIACHVVFIPVLALVEFCESRSLAS